MKKFYAYTRMMLLALVASMALTGCIWEDDDAVIAYDITGRWVGQFSEVYYSKFDWTASGTEYSTMFEFYKDRYDRYSGYGREVDYDRYGNYREMTFRWTVEYGNVYLKYNDGTEIEIDGYSVRNDRLYGRGKIYRSGGTVSMEVSLIRYDYYDDPWAVDSYYWSRKAKTTTDDQTE